MKRIWKLFGSLLGLLALAALVIALTTTFRGLRGETQPASSLFQSPIETPTQPPYPAPQTPTPQVPITPYPSPAPSPTPTATATPIVLPNGWYLYTDPQAGYSFSYPPDAHLSVSQSVLDSYRTVGVAFRLPGVHGYQGMVIRVEPNPQRLPVDRILAQLYTRSAQKPPPDNLSSQVESITVAGLPAVRTSVLPTNTEFYILLPHGDKVYMIAPVHGPAADTVDSKALSLFYRILTTFTVNPSPPSLPKGGASWR